MQAEHSTTRRARTLARVRARKERHRQRSLLYRAAVGAAGGSLVVFGLLLALPGVPGPGLLIAAIGLGLLALEFDRAERLLDRILHRLERAGTTASRATGTQKVLAGLVVLAAAATAVAIVVLLDVPFLPL